MMYRYWTTGLLLGMTLTLSAVAEVKAQFEPRAESPLAQLAETYDTYTEANTFAIDYPGGWRVERLDDKYVRLMNYDPIDPVAPAGDRIKTEIQLIDEAPAVVVAQSLDTLQAENTQVNRYRVVTVDRQSGIRLWLGGLPGEFSHAIRTYVGYGDRQTALIISYYVSPAEGQEAIALEREAALLRIHDSFRKLMTAAAGQSDESEAASPAQTD